MKFLVLVLCILFASFAQAGEFIAGHLDSGKINLSYSMSWEYGAVAQESKQFLDELPVEFKYKVDSSSFADKIEVHVRKLDKQKVKSSGWWNNLKTAASEEYQAKNFKKQYLRHATFLITAGASIYVWTISGFLPHQVFMGASLSVAINALFVYLEDFFDYKVYQNKYSKSLSTEVVKTYKKMKTSVGVGRQILKNQLQSSGYGPELLAKLGQRISKTFHQLQSYMKVESLKNSELLNSVFFEIEEAGQRKKVLVYDRLREKGLSREQLLKSFMTRFFSATTINAALITTYELIKKGFPVDMASTEIIVDRVLENISGVIFIGLAYTLVRGQLKDLYKKGLIKEKTVRWYAFGSRVVLAAAYVSVFTEVVAISTAEVILGYPGWIIALGMILGVHKPFVNQWLLYKARKNARISGKKEVESLSGKGFEVIWNINNYRYLESKPMYCNKLSLGT